ncbi:MAG: hypothetical protein AB9846_13920 [Tenuifilaceae bacterium]
MNKFVFFRVNNVVYDSLNNPCLGVILYFEYNKDGKDKVALGKVFHRDSIAPPHGLINFYELETKRKTLEIINETFCNRNYDSTYNEYFDPRCIYFFYETSNHEKKSISFGKGGDIPPELLNLFHYIEDSCISHGKLVKTRPFEINNMVTDFEKELFLKYPPNNRQNKK